MGVRAVQLNKGEKGTLPVLQSQIPAFAGMTLRRPSGYGGQATRRKTAG